MKYQTRFAAAIVTAAMWCSVAGAQLPAKVGDTPVPSLAPIIKKTSPAVVNIAIRGTVKDSGARNPLLDDPFFRRFFDIPEQGKRERQYQSAGSGVIVDAKNGYIVTNAHVVENADEITVTLLDNRQIKADIVGKDPGSDVALIKIKAPDLVDMPLADSTRAEVGDFVIAIGNPFGLQHTVTSGIISALSRSGINPDGYEDFIQTDASINPGNSGGALVNLQGELVGVNSAILSNGGGNIGIGFAIPSNMVQAVMEQLIKFGEVRRGLLGVNIVTLTPDVAANLGIGNTQGALVSQVVDGSAADKAGIKAGDVVTSINKKNVKSGADLKNTIGLLRVGEKVEISLIRDGKPRRVTAIIGEGAGTTQANAASIHPGLEGAELADTNDKNGVQVKAVAEGSPAAENNLKANDVITMVGRAPVKTLDQLRKEVDQAKAFTLTIKRGTQTIVNVIRRP
jgi:serine protease Do/serine protease DegQ